MTQNVVPRPPNCIRIAESNLFAVFLEAARRESFD